MSRSLTERMTTADVTEPELNGTCAGCQSQAADLTCTCGKKYDFHCINEHIEQVSYQIRECAAAISERMHTIRTLLEAANDDIEDARGSILRWRDESIRVINEIAEKELSSLNTRQTIAKNLEAIRETYERVPVQASRPSHSNLQSLSELHQSIEKAIQDHQNSSHTIQDDNSLYSVIKERLSLLKPESVTDDHERSLPTVSSEVISRIVEPSTTINLPPTLRTESPTADSESVPRPVEVLSTNSFEPLRSESTTAQSELVTQSSATSTANSLEPLRSESTTAQSELVTQSSATSTANSLEPLRRQLTPADLKALLRTTETLTNGTQRSEPKLATNEFQAVPQSVDSSSTSSVEARTEVPVEDYRQGVGLACRIDRTNPIIVESNNDKNAGTLCCHDNKVLYNDYDTAGRCFMLRWIPDITQQATSHRIDALLPETFINENDDEWIQDIVYCDSLSRFLLLNRARLRLFDEESRSFTEFHTFPDRTMKRIAWSGTHFYLIVAQDGTSNYGDQIIVMSVDKEEKVCKTFRDIMPSSLNRGMGASKGEFSDLAANSKERVTVAYRFQRRSEVGFCVFKVTNEGKEWAVIKRLTLNNCWHSDIPFTPRIDWSEKFNAFAFVEYNTGRLVIIDENGVPVGESMFMETRTQRESPLNLSISNNGWVCTRYNSLITINKIID